MPKDVEALTGGDATDFSAVIIAIVNAAAAGVRTGNGNTAAGASALPDIVGAADNAAFGDHALAANTIGSLNVAIGMKTDGGGPLSHNTTGSSNVAIGADALATNVDGNSNVAMGANALLDNVSGTDNVAIGDNTLTHTTVSDLVGVGGGALNHNTTGTLNTAIGTDALTTITTEDSNTAVGFQADINSAGIVNAIAIGKSTKVLASNTAQIGDSGVLCGRFGGATVVGSLPSASTVGAGARAFVTDATATTFLSTVVGGGSNKVPVVSDGANWKIG